MVTVWKPENAVCKLEITEFLTSRFVFVFVFTVSILFEKKKKTCINVMLYRKQYFLLNNTNRFTIAAL